MRITADISTSSPSLNGNISNDGVNLNGNLSFGEIDPSNLKIRVTNLENNTVGTIDLSYDNQTSILTLTTKNIKNESIGTPQVVEIPTGIKNISYNNASKEITITLLNDETMTVSIKSSFDELENIYIKQSAVQQTIESTSVDIPLILKSGVPTASTLAFKNSNDRIIGYLQISYLLDNKLKFTDASHNTKIVAMTDDLTNFITNTVDNLTNYYLKTETYSKTEVNNLIAAIPKVKMEIVQSLPTASETYWFDNSHTVYLTPKSTSQTNNTYDEYVCMRSGTEGSYVYSWEKIGDTEIDLSNYYTKNEVNGLLENYVEKEVTSEQEIGPITVTTYNNVDNRMSMTGLGSTLNRKFDLNDGTELGAWLAVNTLGIIMMQTGMASSPDAQSAVSSVNVEVDASYGITINQLADNITKSIIFRNGNVTADMFIKNGGTSSQFLKADGSIDSNSYATLSELNNYVKLSSSRHQIISISASTDIPVTLKSGNTYGCYLEFRDVNDYTLGILGVNSNRKLTYSAGADDWSVAMTSDLPTKTSDLTNDSGFITNIVDNLTNYYLKSETYTQTEVNALIAAIKTVKLEIVSTLPTADATTYFNESKTIYAIRNSATSGSDYYEEYITVRTGSEGSYAYSWEKIGDTQIDLSNYVQKTFTIAGIDLQDNITKTELQTALTDSTHNFVTDTEKSTWNSKQDALTAGSHIDITNDVISAEGGVYRGTFGTWNDVPSTTTGYEQDAQGNTTPLKNDYLIINNGNGILDDSSLLYQSDTSGSSASMANTYKGITQSVIYYNATGQANAKTLNNVVSVYYDSGPGQWVVTTLVACSVNGTNYAVGDVIARWGYSTYHEQYVVYGGSTDGGTLIYDGVWATNGKNGWKGISSLADMTSGINSKISAKQDALTQTQLNAVNSGIDSTKVAQITTNTTNITNLQNSKQDKITNANKLSADLVNDTNTTNKFVTQSDKETWNSKQDTLVSGTNIKTINNTSLLGSGNISISGGTPTDVQVDSTSITSSGVANLKTVGGNYNSGSNKLLTKNDLLNQVYPVGSIYLTVGSSSPASWLGGTWTKLPAGYALWTASSGAFDGSNGTISAGLPNIKGTIGGSKGVAFRATTASDVTKTGAFSGTGGWTDSGKIGSGNYDIRYTNIDFKASNSNSIYSDNISTVQPPAIKVYAWRRTA